MDFARKQLEKYGWTDGKGLGKNENGISEALKPKLKRSATGIGYDVAADFTEHWWSALYDKAASNVQVEEENGKTKKMKRVEDKEFEITNSTWRLKKKNNQKSTEEYSDFFVKTAVLGSGGSKTTKVIDSDSEDEICNRNVTKMTDEELFAACQGRTAHKGARHGLRALGKLARIEQQEQILLQQSKYNNFRAKKSNSNDTQIVESTRLEEETNIIKKKRKKKKRCNSNENECYDNIITPNIVENDPTERIKEKEMINNDILTDDEHLEKKSKKSKKKEIIESQDVTLDSGEVTESIKPKKKKKRKTKSDLNEEECQMDPKIQESEPESSLRKKKKKKK